MNRSLRLTWAQLHEVRQLLGRQHGAVARPVSSLLALRGSPVQVLLGFPGDIVWGPPLQLKD